MSSETEDRFNPFLFELIRGLTGETEAPTCYAADLLLNQLQQSQATEAGIREFITVFASLHPSNDGVQKIMTQLDVLGYQAQVRGTLITQLELQYLIKDLCSSLSILALPRVH